MHRSSAKLLDDASYISIQAAQSQFPYQYLTLLKPNPRDIGKAYTEPCTGFTGGCRQFAPPSTIVDTFNSLLPGITRPSPRPQTELFGTAPYKARGDGTLTHPQVHSDLHDGFNPHCARALGEVDYDRFSCISAPNAAESGPRGGVSTRFGAVYVNNHAARC